MTQQAGSEDVKGFFGGRYRAMRKADPPAGAAAAVIAEDRILRREVIVAVLPDDADVDAMVDRQSRLREHPGISTLYDAGVQSETPFLVFQDVGGPLHSRSCTSLELAASLVSCCNAVATLHRCGLWCGPITSEAFRVDGDGAISLCICGYRLLTSSDRPRKCAEILSDYRSLADALEPLVRQVGVADPSYETLLHGVTELRDGRTCAGVEAARMVGGAGSVDSVEVRRLIRDGEDKRHEFKSSMRYPHGSPGSAKVDSMYRRLQMEIVRAVAAFRNSSGGVLLVGVSDDGGILGIEHDFETLTKNNEDGWQLSLKDILKSHLTAVAAAEVVLTFVPMEERTVAVLRVSQGGAPTWVVDGTAERFYVRIGASTEELPPRQAFTYIGRHWPPGGAGDEPA